MPPSPTPFWFRLLADPVEALDLTDPHGRADHGKILPAVLLVSAIVAQFVGRPFPVPALIVLGSLSYGYGAWRAFLKARAVTHHTERREVDVAVHAPPRDVAEGVQPTVA